MVKLRAGRAWSPLQQHPKIRICDRERLAQKGKHTVTAAAACAKVKGLAFSQQYARVGCAGLFPRGLQKAVGAVVVVGLQFQKLQRIPAGIV